MRRIIIAVVVALLATLVAAQPAEAGRYRHLRCWEADAPVAACEAAGWFMHRQAHIGPRNVLRYVGPRLEPCGEYVGSWEEGLTTAVPPIDNCWWDHQRRGGDELGESYVVVGDYGVGMIFLILHRVRIGSRGTW